MFESLNVILAVFHCILLEEHTRALLVATFDGDGKAGDLPVFVEWRVNTVVHGEYLFRFQGAVEIDAVKRGRRLETDRQVALRVSVVTIMAIRVCVLR